MKQAKEMITKSRHLVIGLGEVGSALKKVLEEKYQNVQGLDRDGTVEGDKFDVIHICFPYKEGFVEIAQQYYKQYAASPSQILRPNGAFKMVRRNGGLLIIHSTVPLGTTRKVDPKNAVHSPVRGVHPNLGEGIKTFDKYFGGPRAIEAAGYFHYLGIKPVAHKTADTVEALKLWDTTYYGWNIMYQKMLYEWCKKNKLDYNLIYVHGNASYNVGYSKLKRNEVIRPVLKYMPGKIGGHCVIPNCELLGDNPVPKFILEQNERL